ncbi:Homoserine dehydrogenase [Clostridium bornimense]|uniref:Homoserine dehydrogenase n=1 Tax=Clostridium bornimense TaxID=1216932 RepID=W6S468_9CLOT|nr:homoserine dehydrogenase [Clostridium bornimense]CDM69132.1 Homoserine dehydrogenase [Clostridium bornimense]
MGKLKVALLGLGNVGSGVYKILTANKAVIEKRSGYEIEVGKILVRDKNKPRPVDVDEDIVTTNIDDILNDDEISIVVELMGGEEPAKSYILRAIEKKKHVVTANKLLMAKCGVEVFNKAKEVGGVHIHYEASVAGGIPIIQGINEALTGNKIEKVIGIINGTTNYILTEMEDKGLSFEEALKGAQEKGYAEADPTSDIEGFDTLYKLDILTALCFNKKVPVDTIYREGITKISKGDIEIAKEFGYKIKLLAIGSEVDGKIEARVHPTMIPAKHPLANVNDSFNAIMLKGDAVGDLMFYGRGAGDLPTGSAVVGDIIAVAKNLNNEPSGLDLFEENNKKALKDMKDVESEYYLRLNVLDTPGTLAEISSIFALHKISILSLIQRGDRKEGMTDIIFITHKAKEEAIRNSIEAFENLGDKYKVENIIRIENFN